MDFSQALSLAREHTSIVQRMELALKNDVNNKSLALGYGSALRRAKRSEEILENFAASSQIDLFRYRLVHDTDLYAIEAVTESVRTFQKSFTGAADFLESGPKSKAKYSSQVENRTRLNFGYSYSGSLGIVLAVENSRNLFDAGDLDKVMDVFEKFLNISDEHEAVDASRSLGGGLISQLCHWVDVNAKWENAVDVITKHSNGIQRGQYVTKNKFFDLSDIFREARDIEPNVIESNGILVGIDLVLKKFHFVVPNGDSYKGDLSDDFRSEPTVVGKSFKAKMDEKIIRHVATGKEDVRYSLISLIPLST